MSDEFAELDMTESEFDAMAAAGEPVHLVVPIAWECQHVRVSVSGDTHPTSPPLFGCCKPVPVSAAGQEPDPS